MTSFHLLKLVWWNPALRGSNHKSSFLLPANIAKRPVEIHLLGKVASQVVTWLLWLTIVAVSDLHAARSWKTADWWCKLNKLWPRSVQDSSSQQIKPKRNMLDDLLWIPARKIQEAVSMMWKADSCQAACYQHPHLRSMIAGACTCLDSIAGDTLHLTRDPLLSTRSSWGYLKKPAGSWGNGSLTWCWTITAHSHHPSQSCPAVTTHISTPWKNFSIPAWMTWIIILNAASTKLNFHNTCLEKVVKSGVSQLGVETYADLLGGCTSQLVAVDYLNSSRVLDAVRSDCTNC